jgi:thymidylate synthase
MILTAQEAWHNTLGALINYGPTHTEIKGALDTVITSYEILGHQQVSDMRHPMIEVPGRLKIAEYALSEASFIIDGGNRLIYSDAISTTLRKWSVDKVFVRGAYGPKFTDQMPYILETFRYDLSSRRAFINIWRESPGPSKDTPCLCSLQYIIRDNSLHCIATMRSSDAWLGLPNDTIVFAALADYIRKLVNDYLDLALELGNLHNTASSRHIYEKDVNKVMEILK